MKKEKKLATFFMMTLKYLMPSVFLLFILRGFIFIPVSVDGNSMDKTLAPNDMVLMEKFSPIRRFDIVVFKLPSGSIYIKRVIGLPGDSIRYENDQLYINNQPMNEEFLVANQKKDHEIAPYTTDFNLIDLVNQEIIPENNYFVLGDNRRISKDSRSFGIIEHKYILGKVRMVYYPFNHIKFI